MPRKLYDAKRFAAIYNDFIHHPTNMHVAMALGVNERTIRDWVIKARKEGVELVDRSSIDPATDSLKYGQKIAELNAKISRMQVELKASMEERVDGHKLLDLFYEAKDYTFDREQADWLTYDKGKRTGLTGIPTLFISDVHFDEVVNPAEIGYVNAYNREIADRRLKSTFDTALDLLTQKMHSPKYEGSVIMLGGDLLSGVIHQELADTNDNHILKSLADLSEILIGGIGQFADEFGKVYVPCVVGNHGRLHHKPRAKSRVIENYEWLIYHLVAKHFRNDDRVSVEIPESADCIFPVYNKTICLTHGDQFKGGSGISGIFAPLFIGQARKQRRAQAIRNPFDILAMGHWHQYIHTESLIVNSSVKGYDEYAYIMNFPFEKAQQAMWIVHPEYGVTYRMPVLCDPAGTVFTSRKRAS